MNPYGLIFIYFQAASCFPEGAPLVQISLTLSYVLSLSSACLPLLSPALNYTILSLVPFVIEQPSSPLIWFSIVSYHLFSSQSISSITSTPHFLLISCPSSVTSPAIIEESLLTLLRFSHRYCWHDSYRAFSSSVVLWRYLSATGHGDISWDIHSSWYRSNRYYFLAPITARCHHVIHIMCYQCICFIILLSALTMGSRSILSMDLGPRVVRMISATACIESEQRIGNSWVGWEGERKSARKDSGL